MCPSLARAGWFLRRSTPGWRTAGGAAVFVAVAAPAAAFALAGPRLAFGLALAGFLSVILAMSLSLLSCLLWLRLAARPGAGRGFRIEGSGIRDSRVRDPRGRRRTRDFEARRLELGIRHLKSGTLFWVRT